MLVNSMMLMDKTKEKIVKAYIDYLVEHKKQPKSIHSFVEQLKLKEGSFYKYYSSFDDLEKDFWKVLFDKTVEKIQSEEVYQSYTVSEKLLAFYFTWIEAIKDYRSYATYIVKNERFYELYPSCFESFKESFESFSNQLVEEGVVTHEIANRMLITGKYKYLIWYQPVSIFKFWVKDKSNNFEDTDALIEKTVNFSFDLMRSNGVDSFIDLAKFHIQHF